MLVASRVPVPVGVIPWRDRPGRATIVVKLSFEIKRWGTAVRAERPDPLTPDTFSDAGSLLFPTDFALSKTQCDVLVVGRALTLAPAQTKIKATGLLKVVDHAAALGPVACSSPENRATQFAPIDQRVPPPRLPLRLHYERAEEVIEAFLPGPIPQIGIVRRGAFSVVPAPVDLLALDPERKRLMIAIRGTVDQVDKATVVVVDEAGTLPDSWSSDGGAWPTYQATVVGELMDAPPDARPYQRVSRAAFVAVGPEALVTSSSDSAASERPSAIASVHAPTSTTPDSDAVDTVPRERSTAKTRPHGTAASMKADNRRLPAELSPAAVSAAPQALIAVSATTRPMDVTLRAAQERPIPKDVQKDVPAQPLVRSPSRTIPAVRAQRERSATLPLNREGGSPRPVPREGGLDPAAALFDGPAAEPDPDLSLEPALTSRLPH